MTTATTSPPLTGAEARRAARNAGAIAAARILSSGALLVWQLILGRLLGDSEFGVYSTVGALFNIGVTFTAFGMGAILIRDVARRADLAGQYFASSLTLQTLLALIAYIGINLAGIALGYSEAIRAFAAVAAISLFTDLCGNAAYDVLLAREKMVVASAVDVIHVFIRIGLAGLALALGFGLLGVYVVTIFTGLGRAAALWIALRWNGITPKFPLDRALSLTLLLNGLPLAAAAFINITYTQIDKLMTTSILTEADTGHLNAAFVIIVGVVEVLSTTVITAVYPIMSRLYVPQGSTDGQGASADGVQTNAMFRMIIEKLAFFTLLISLPLGLMISAFAGAVAVPLFGADFAPTADILRILIWYACITMVANVFSQGMLVQNRQRHLVVIRVGGLIFKLILNLLLLSRVGVIGAAVASVTAELIVLTLLGRDYKLGTLIVSMLPRLTRLGLIAAAALAAMILLGGLHPIVGMIGGGIVYMIGVLTLRVLADDDWDLLYRLAAAVPGGSVVIKYWRRDVKLNW
jgi:O-antigen/teichoic acid export membrane protein